MESSHSPFANWTEAEITAAQRWVKIWTFAGADLERIKRQELRSLDVYSAIEKLCGDFDSTAPPRAPKPYSGQWNSNAGS